MFTGIIEELGELISLRPSDGGYRLRVGANSVLEGTRLGDSIAVNGICLTVVVIGAGSFEADVMPETYRRSSLSCLKPRSKLNLERALLPNGRLGGHLVSGHIDGLAHLSEKRREGNSLWLTFEPEPELMKYIVFKGSVAIDGASLTVAGTEKGRFSVGLIPATQKLTTLALLDPGDSVNVETDMIAKYVERLLAAYGGMNSAEGRSNIDVDFLKRNGYA